LVLPDSHKRLVVIGFDESDVDAGEVFLASVGLAV
jgi:hypothetical protein